MVWNGNGAGDLFIRSAAIISGGDKYSNISIKIVVDFRSPEISESHTLNCLRVPLGFRAVFHGAEMARVPRGVSADVAH